jgi:hypothetical protein
VGLKQPTTTTDKKNTDRKGSPFERKGKKKKKGKQTEQQNTKHKVSNYSKIAYALKSLQPTKEVDHTQKKTPSTAAQPH